MKKVKLGLIGAALTLSVGAAFATSSKEAVGKFANYNWQSVDANGDVIPVANGGVYSPNLSVVLAKSDYGCSGIGTVCAVTVPSQDTPPAPGAIYIYRN